MMPTDRLAPPAGFARSGSSPRVHGHRPARRLRPAVEGLEGRALLATTGLDPTFGTAGSVLGPDVGIQGATATAIQADGKILVVGEFNGQAPNGSATSISIRRYDADGTIDATFGTNGQFNLPVPTGFDMFQVAPANLAIAGDGTIVLAATVGTDQVSTATPAPPTTEGIIYRLTTTGQLDTSFATGGEFLIATTVIDPDLVAVQADGAILATGEGGSTSNSHGNVTAGAAVIRLTTAGALDPTFNATGVVQIPPSPQAAFGGSNSPVGLVIGSGGQIYVASNETADPTVNTSALIPLLTRISASGTVDTAYRTAAQRALQAGANFYTLSGLAVQADGKAVVIGTGNSPGLTQYGQRARIDVDGTIDRSSLVASRPAATFTQAEEYDAVVVDPDGSVTIGGTALVGGLHDFLVDRFLASGAPDPSFGVAGRIIYQVAPSFAVTGANELFETANSLALTAAGKIVVAGSIEAEAEIIPGGPVIVTPQAIGIVNVGTQAVVTQLLPIATDPFTPIIPIVPLSSVTPTPPASVAPASAEVAPDDFDGDGKTDIAAELTLFGLFASRPSGGGSDVLTAFGPAGAGQAIPAPGDYDGDGKTDIAAYLPAYGVLAYRPSSGRRRRDRPVRHRGSRQLDPGAGGLRRRRQDRRRRLPARLRHPRLPPVERGRRCPDAVRLRRRRQTDPRAGRLRRRRQDRPGGLPARLRHPGVSPQLGRDRRPRPVRHRRRRAVDPRPGRLRRRRQNRRRRLPPGDGILAYRPSAGGADVLTQFGTAGAGNSIPAPGDYDGDGKTDVAVYLPASATSSIAPAPAETMWSHRSVAPERARPFRLTRSPAPYQRWPAPCRPRWSPRPTRLTPRSPAGDSMPGRNGITHHWSEDGCANAGRTGRETNRARGAHPWGGLGVGGVRADSRNRPAFCPRTDQDL